MSFPQHKQSRGKRPPAPVERWRGLDVIAGPAVWFAFFAQGLALRSFARNVVGLLVPLVVALAACEDDPTSIYGENPVLAGDTLVLMTPDAARPVAEDTAGSALDIGSTVETRRPERVLDVGRWDVALRRRGTQLVLAPAPAIGGQQTQAGAGVTRPVTGSSFEQVADATDYGSFVTDSVVPLDANAVYVLRSRFLCRDPLTGSAAGNYAKLQALAVDAAAGTVRLQIVGNLRCGDPRLSPND